MSPNQRGFRYTKDEIHKLLNIIKIILPLSELEWLCVARYHNEDFERDSYQ